MLIPLLAYDHAYRSSFKAEHRAYLIFYIALVREMEQLTAVAENDEIGRLDSGLRHVIYLEPSALIRGRLYARLSIGKNVVEHAGSYAHVALIVYEIDQLKYPVGALAGFAEINSTGA